MAVDVAFEYTRRYGCSLCCRDAFRVGGLCERRVRRARAKTFATRLCRAAAGDITATATNGGGDDWREDSESETEAEADPLEDVIS